MEQPLRVYHDSLFGREINNLGTVLAVLDGDVPETPPTSLRDKDTVSHDSHHVSQQSTLLRGGNDRLMLQ